MKSAKAHTQSFALLVSAINAYALIIVACCDRVVVVHFSTQLLELTVRKCYLTQMTKDEFFYDSNLSKTKTKIDRVVRE